jgi:carbonic anhydrase/acetyltransferase-like protein (isoleucine patch superfamily)
MLMTHAGKHPRIDPSAWIAPDATVCGDVAIGAGSRVLHGARLIGEGGGAIRSGATASSWRTPWCARALATAARWAIAV